MHHPFLVNFRRIKVINNKTKLQGLALVGTLLAACAAPTPTAAPKPTDAPKPAAPAAAPTAAPAAPAAAPAVTCKSPEVSKATTVSLLGNKFGIMEHYARALEACKNANLKVNVEWLAGADLTAKENASMSAGTSPYDIIQPPDSRFVEYAAKGWLHDLTPLVNKYKDQYKLGDIPDPIWAAASYNGKIYGVPLLQNMQVLYYRKDIFDELKLKPPATYDELIEVSKKLMESKKTPYAYAAVWKKGGDFSAEFSNWLQSYDGEWFDKDAKPTFNSDKGVAAAKKMAEVLQYMPPDTLNMDTNGAMIAFQQEQVAMVNIWITRGARINDPKESKVVGKVGYAPAPSSKVGGVPGGTWARDFYAITKNSANDPELVFKMIMEATTAENQRSGGGLGFVPRANVAAEPEVVKANPYTEAVLTAIKQGAKSGPLVPYFSIGRTPVGNIVADALATKGDLAAALNKSADEATKELKDKGFLK